MPYTINDLLAFLQTGTKTPPTKSELAALAAQVDKLPPAQREALLRLLKELAEKGAVKADLRKTNEAYWANVKHAEAEKQRQEARLQEEQWEEIWDKALLLKKDEPAADVGEGAAKAANIPAAAEAAPLPEILETPAERAAVAEAAELIAPDEPEEISGTRQPGEGEPPTHRTVVREWDCTDNRFTTVMKSYRNSFQAALDKLLATDKGIPDLKNSTFYRKFRGALKTYLDMLSDPSRWAEVGILSDDNEYAIRRKWAAVPECSALEEACRIYLVYCQDTSDKGKSPRRAERMRQTEDVRELLWCLRGGVDEPLDYARYKLAERAMQGAGQLFQASRDPQTAETGRKILENLNSKDVSRQQTQVFQIYEKKAFQGFTKPLSFAALCELRRGEPAEVVNRCHKLQVEWSMERMKNTPAVQPPEAETTFQVRST